MPGTPNFNWPYPDFTYAPDGPDQFANMAKAIDTTVDAVRDSVTALTGTVTALNTALNTETARPTLLMKTSTDQTIYWASVVVTANSGGFFSVNFPAGTFTAIPFVICATGDSNAASRIDMNQTSLSAGGFTGSAYNADGTDHVSTPVRVNYIAIGA